MKINEASGLLKSLITETTKKSDIKVYQSFLGILTALKNRELTQEDVRSIEEELDILKLKAYPENRKKYLRRKRDEFKKYLKDEFSLISEGYYTSIGIGIGMTMGIAIGTSIFGAESGVALGILFGMVIGLVIGRNMDNQAEKENRVLKVSQS
jgi:hypothetical protein